MPGTLHFYMQRIGLIWLQRLLWGGLRWGGCSPCSRAELWNADFGMSCWSERGTPLSIGNSAFSSGQQVRDGSRKGQASRFIYCINEIPCDLCCNLTDHHTSLLCWSCWGSGLSNSSLCSDAESYWRTLCVLTDGWSKCAFCLRNAAVMLQFSSVGSIKYIYLFICDGNHGFLKK